MPRAAERPRCSQAIAAVGAALAAMLLLGGCRPQQALAPKFLDLVTSNPASGSVLCGERDRFALALNPDVERRFELPEEATGGTLLVEACARRSPSAETLTLDLRLERADEGVQLTETIPLGRFEHWVRRVVAVPAATTAVVLSSSAPGTRSIYLGELAVEYQAPVGGILRGPSRQLLLISVDTLREDGIRALGGKQPTPHLDELAGHSQIVRSHYAAASWTKPSHASLLTGEYPAVHGANGFEGAIAPAVTTLAERLLEAGFSTGGLVHHIWLSPKVGFDRGFEDYRVEDWHVDQQLRHALNWIAAHREKPFFFFLHVMEAHSDFRRLPYESSTASIPQLLRQYGVERYGCREGICASDLLNAIGRGKLAPLPNEAEILKELYGRGIADLDEAFGTLLAGLQEIGVLDQMTLVLTSDHGESLLEDGKSTMHGNTTEETLRVPLLIKWPDGRSAGTAAHPPTSAIDLVPTLLDSFGLTADGLPGRPLRPGGPSRPVFVESGGSTVVIDGGFKGVFDGEAYWLYDFRHDSNARRDVSRQHPEVVTRLRELLIRQRAEASRRSGRLGTQGARDGGRLSAEEREQLRALGYLGADPAGESPP